FGFHLQQRGFRLTPLNKLKWLGDFSYTLYVTHWPIVLFLVPVWAWWCDRRVPASGPLRMLFIMGVPMAIAWAVHLFAERPFTRGHAPKPRAVVGEGVTRGWK